MKPQSVKLKFHSIEGDPGDGKICVAEAIDAATGLPLASLSLSMMAAWLRKNDFQYETGSNGVWRRKGKAA